MPWLIAICIALSLSMSLLMVPLVRTLACRFGMVDHPDSDRKLHRDPVALGCGVAVGRALSFTFVATLLIDRNGIVRYMHKGFKGDSGAQIAAEVAELLAE